METFKPLPLKHFIEHSFPLIKKSELVCDIELLVIHNAIAAALRENDTYLNMHYLHFLNIAKEYGFALYENARPFSTMKILYKRGAYICLEIVDDFFVNRCFLLCDSNKEIDFIYGLRYYMDKYKDNLEKLSFNSKKYAVELYQLQLVGKDFFTKIGFFD